MYRVAISFLAILFFVSACKKEDTVEGDIVESLEVTKNPSGFAPLTALIKVRTKRAAKVSILVKGKNGVESDISHNFETLDTEFEIPVLGLYPSYNNKVFLTFTNEDGLVLDEEEVGIFTPSLIADLPEIEIDQYQASEYKNGINFVNYFGHNGDQVPQRAFAFDAFGDIRWFINFKDDPELGTLFYDNGMVKLQNGNFVFGNGNTGKLYEMNRLGEILQVWSLNGYGFHHHVIEKPNGNLLVTVNESGTTVEDVILELDRASGSIVNKWDLKLSLQKDRQTMETDIADLDVDWFHANALEYSPSDDCIIVSGRTQGVVKLNAANEVQWILAPHKGWGTSGTGIDLNDFLLQPLDASGNPIADQAVLEGMENHPEFEWNWYQHSCILMPNGNLMLFDNGDNRNFNATGFSGIGNYSRAVAYKIDPTSKTIQQVWEYGKSRGDETFSRIVSKVNYYPNENRVMFCPGAVFYGGYNYGKIIEVDYSNKSVVFEATIRPPQTIFNITFHSAIRDEMY